MNRDRRSNLVVGAFGLGCLALLAYAVLSLSAERGFWSPRYRLVAYFEDVQGLIAGAPVRLAGKDVGIVEAVRFAELGSDTAPIVVELLIQEAAQQRIRSDSRAMIATFGFLGDKYIEISLGTRAGTILPDGAELVALIPADMNDLIEKGTSVLDEVAALASNLNEVVEDVGGQQIEKEVAQTAAAVSALVTEIRDGSGLLHSLIYDEYEGRGVESIGRSLATLEELLGEIAHGEGTLHTLIYEPPDQLGLISEARDTGAQLNRILARLERGEGTLGLLLTDPTLYEDLKQLVDGAQRSLVVRSLIKMSGDGSAP